MFWHASRERHGFRAWWHLRSGKRNRVVSTEVNWWARFCHIGVEVGDEGWEFSLAFPPLAVWLQFDLGWWVPRRKHVFHWDNNREVWLPDHREFKLAIHNWTIWFTPWGKWGEWSRADPWWVRGVSWNIQDFALGRVQYTQETIGDPLDVSIPMPEGVYRAVFTPQRQTWKRPRWFSQVRESFDIQIPKGIPFAGKGENSWDCGDDGLFGMGAEGSVQDAIARVRETVLERRRRYGSPSEDAIREALA
jgi:hypothetical protein